MKIEAAEIIANYGGEIYENYSGRGMYDKTTTGITFGSQTEFNRAFADAIKNSGDDDEKELLTSALSKLQTDNMGLSIIFY